MEFVAQPQQELGRLAHGLGVFVRQFAPLAERIGLAGSISGLTDPAEQLQIAQPTPRSLEIGFEEVDGLAVTEPFLRAILLDGRQDRGASSGNSSVKRERELLEQRRMARQKT